MQVIYHLNTKNEDNDFDMQDLCEQYEAEIEQILRETNEKISFYKLQMEEATGPAAIARITQVSPQGALPPSPCQATRQAVSPCHHGALP